MNRDERVLRALLSEYGQTYAEEAGITLKDTPQPLYRLLVLALLLSARIRASVAVAAARELHKDHLDSPRRMAYADWQQRVDALGRGGYRRYDERTATQLGDGAELLLDRWAGDLQPSCTRRRTATPGNSGGCSRRSRASDRPARTSSCARRSACGRSSRRTWTARRCPGRSGSACRGTRRS